MNNELELKNTLEQIGIKLRHARHKNDAKLQTVALNLNISHTVISMVENGRYHSFNFALLLTLLECYGLELKEITFLEKANRNGDAHPAANDQKKDNRKKSL